MFVAAIPASIDVYLYNNGMNLATGRSILNYTRYSARISDQYNYNNRSFARIGCEQCISNRDRVPLTWVCKGRARQWRSQRWQRDCWPAKMGISAITAPRPTEWNGVSELKEQSSSMLIFLCIWFIYGLVRVENVSATCRTLFNLVFDFNFGYFNQWMQIIKLKYIYEIRISKYCWCLYFKMTQAQIFTCKLMKHLWTISTIDVKAQSVCKLRGSAIDVISGMEPICQSWLSVEGHNINHQLKAAK